MLKFFKKIILFLIPSLILLFLAYKYFQQSVSFSFVDEYDNFIAAYFMLSGKKLFTEIFHNRQFGPVFLSYLIQLISHPNSLYQLIMFHRVFVILFSFMLATLLSIRFGLIAILFALLYEPIKFYFHGNLFLGESLIVYPLIYLFFLIFDDKKKEFRLDYILVAIFFWFICFMREPYIPLVSFLFLLYSVRLKKIATSKWTLSIILFLTILSLIGVNLKEYFFQLLQVNSNRIFIDKTESINSINLLKSFFYPFTVFFGGAWNYFRFITMIYSITVITLSTLVFKTTKKYWIILTIFTILGLAAIRPNEAGKVFYGMYRMSIWYGFMIASVLILFKYLLNNKKISYFMTVGLLLILFIISYWPSSFIYKKINREETFNISYNRYFVNGEVVKTLSNPGDTLFVDGYESLIFWQAKIPSPYKYTLYYPVMKGIDRFDKERVNMLKNITPAFYFTDCNLKKINPIPSVIKLNYRQFLYIVNNEETCLYVNKNKISEEFITKLKTVEKFNYKLTD